MPQYKLPKSEKDKLMEMPQPAVGPDDYDRQVHFPVNDEILDSVEVDDEITVVLTGKVSSKVDRTSSDGHDEQSVTISVLSVSIPDEEKSDEDAVLDAFNKGFNKKRPY